MLFGVHLMAQPYVVKGRIVDATTLESLAFIKIVINSSKIVELSDIDGKFMLRSVEPITKLKISSIGYQTTEIVPDLSGKEILVKLKKQEAIVPEEILKPGLNPANRIINQVVDHRGENNPKALEAFSYISYDKLVAGTNLDSIPLTDSLLSGNEFTRMKDFFEGHHLFLLETETERKYMQPDKNYSKVKASRVSGLSDPLLIFLFSQFQSISFYNEFITILDKNYINPISTGSASKYYFRIEDTLLHEPATDTMFIISFRPFLNTDFNGLKGFLFVNSEKWAISNVIAEPAQQSGLIEISIKQSYAKIERKQWFPVQLSTEFSLNNSEIAADRTYGKIMGIAKSYRSHIVLNPVLVKREFSNIEIDLDTNDSHQKTEFRNIQQSDSTYTRERLANHLIDSIGKAEKAEKYYKTMKAILNDHLQLGVFNLDVNRFMHYNRYQGFYAGLGLHSNDRLSKLFNFGGYWGYGFASKSATYGADGTFIIDHLSETNLKLELSHDVSESGGLPDYGEIKRLFDPAGFYNLLVRRMDLMDLRQVTISTAFVKFIRAGISIFQSLKTPTYDYAYVISQNSNIAVLNNQFHFSGLSFNLRYAYGETIRSRSSGISTNTTYPIVSLQLTRSIAGWFGGEYSYTRFDLEVEKSFQTNNLGRSSFCLQAGAISGDVPYCNLFDNRGSYREFTIYAPQSFATMRQNEFTSDRYASLFLNYNFGKLLSRSLHFNPELTWCASASFGDLTHPEKHHGIEIRTITKGYFESGFLLNKLLDLKLYNLGLGAFYRLGSYAFAAFDDNIAFKFSVKFSL